MSRTMSKDLRIMKSTKHNVKSKQRVQFKNTTQRAKNGSQLGHKARRRTWDHLSSTRSEALSNKRMGDLPKRRLSMASFAFYGRKVCARRSLSLTVHLC